MKTDRKQRRGVEKTQSNFLCALLSGDLLLLCEALHSPRLCV